jgi:hypothetical protein
MFVIDIKWSARCSLDASHKIAWTRRQLRSGSKSSKCSDWIKIHILPPYPGPTKLSSSCYFWLLKSYLHDTKNAPTNYWSNNPTVCMALTQVLGWRDHLSIDTKQNNTDGSGWIGLMSNDCAHKQKATKQYACGNRSYRLVIGRYELAGRQNRPTWEHRVNDDVPCLLIFNGTVNENS